MGYVDDVGEGQLVDDEMGEDRNVKDDVGRRDEDEHYGQLDAAVFVVMMVLLLLLKLRLCVGLHPISLLLDLRDAEDDENVKNGDHGDG